MVPARVVAPALGALAVAVAGPSLVPTLATAASPSAGTATVSLSSKAPAAASLRQAKVTVSASKPASARRTRWTLPVSGTAASNATTVDLDGRLRFARGKRNVTFTALRLSLGRKPAISGTVGKRRVTVLTLTGSPKRDAAKNTISLKGSRASLTSASVRVLRRGLSTSRLKSGRLGTTTVAVRAVAVAPAPQPPVVPAPVPPAVLVPPIVNPPVVPPAPEPQPEPQPEAPCWADTPANATDWIACGAQTGGNLRSWITYVRRGGSITPSGAATVTPSGTDFDHRFPVAAIDPQPDGGVTIAHLGRIAYSYPEHMIDMWVENLRFLVAADRTSARVVVDASYPSFANPSEPPVFRSDVEVMTVDLAAARSTSTAAGGTTYVAAPAKLTADGRMVWSNFYAVGSPFGAFTITVPESAAD